LRGHAVETLRAFLRARKRHIGNRTRDPAVAVVEGMNGDKPEMGNSGLEDGIDFAILRI
jgi:hypothetical protein